MVSLNEEEQKLGLSQRITEYYRARILDGSIPAGSQLPSTQELAKRFGASIASAQHALSSLKHEGLITRRPHYGTIVNEYKPELKVVAIIVFAKLQVGPKPYEQSLCGELIKELHEHNCEAITIIEDVDNPNIKRIKDIINKFTVRGIIPLAAPKEIFEMLKDINLPSVTNSGGNADSHVKLDMEKLPELAINEFHNLNCKRPAMITSCERNIVNKAYFENWQNLIMKNQMEFYPDFVQVIPEKRYFNVKEYCDFAFEAFDRLWSNPKCRMDSLFVFTDNLIPGVVEAIHHHHITVPGELKLIMHKNLEIDVYCRLPFIQVINSTAEHAAAMVEQLFELFHHHKPEDRKISFRIIKP